MDKIAIIGMSCLFPGAHTPQEFWHNLLAERDLISTVSAEKIGVDPQHFYHPEKGQRDRYYTMRGSYINDFTFDPTGYHLPPDALCALDDTFTWSLYVARQALLDSGYLDNPAVLTRCGAILGSLDIPTRASVRLFSPLYASVIASALQELVQRPDIRLEQLAAPGDTAPENGLMPGFQSAIVARALGLSGMHMCIDAACATSLYAVKLACDYLQSGQVDLMLAGSVSCYDPLFKLLGFCVFQAYPGSGEDSRPLDASSRGLLSGEGAGMFALKRYSDAVRDGDRIYATIQGVGLSNDGRGKHPLFPNAAGQLLAFERAYVDAGIDPASVAYVECHATGTPAGDMAEMTSLENFFGRHGAVPRIGSVKSNFGHLLTTAGMASMIKVIYAMNHNHIPATIKVDTPLTSPNQAITADHVVRAAMPWPDQSAVKRAGINAFGFGGVNAHLILEHAPAAASEQPAQAIHQGTASQEQASPPQHLAIVGMDAHFGGCDGLDAFARCLYDGTQQFIPLPEKRWKGMEAYPEALRMGGISPDILPHGAFIDDIEIDFRRFKIPPLEDDRPIQQHLLLLKVADNALRDAAVAEGGNVAVLVAMGSDLSMHQVRGRANLSWQIRRSLEQQQIFLSEQEEADLEALLKDSLHHWPQVNSFVSFIGNIIASRVASLWNFSGPAFTISTESNGVFHALEVARLLLANPEIEAVVVGAVDLAGGLEHVLTRSQFAPLSTGEHTLSYDQNVNGWQIGEGAGAIVLKRPEQAQQAGNNVYAVINPPGFAQQPALMPTSDTDVSPAALAVEQAAIQAIAGAGMTAADVEYLEVCGSGIAQEDDAEIAGLSRVYQANGATPSCAIGSVKASIGHTFQAAGIASIIKTALCLYQRYIPAVPGWSAPTAHEAWQHTPFFVAPDSRPWFNKTGAPPRTAAINSLGMDGSHVHMIMSEYAQQQERRTSHLQQMPLNLYPIAATDQEGLLRQLDELEQTVQQGTSPSAAARSCFDTWSRQPSAVYALALVAQEQDELLREIERARTGIASAFAEGGEWKTPTGSYFTAQPLGRQGKVAFVYPGAFNAYIGLGRQAFQLFPGLHESIRTITSNPGQLIGETLLYPRSLERLSDKQIKDRESRLVEESISMLEIGTSFATLYTTIMRDYFQVQPDIAFGYSQGESAMMHALGVLPEGEETNRALRTSELYKTRLSGPKNTVREFWGVDDPVQAGDDLWANYVLMAPAEQVTPHLQDEPNVYLAIIDAPREVMLAGDPAACKRVIAKIKCRSLRAPFNHVIHSPPVQLEYDEFVKINTGKVQTVPGIRFYSAAEYAPIELTSEAVAHHLSQVCCQQLDFPRLVQRVYEDGARIFLELGPMRNCSHWIDAILKEQDHMAIAINKKGVDDHTSIVRVLARLLSHRVSLDLSPLYQSEESISHAAKKLIKRISTGGERIGAVIETPANQKRFREALDQARLRLPDPQLATYKTTLHNQEEAGMIDNTEATQGTSAVVDTPIEQVEQAPAATLTNGPAWPAPPAPLSSLRETNQLWNGHGAKGDTRLPAATSDIHQMQPHMQNTAQVAQAHTAFLDSRRESLHQLDHIIQQYMAGVQQATEQQAFIEDTGPDTAAPTVQEEAAPISPTPPQPPFIARYTTPEQVIWDEADLLEFADGKIANVFGEEYAIIDTYRCRVRLPLPPYLLVSRVTHIDGKRGVFQPCTITTEYDIPRDAWYSVDRQAPWAVATESGQCDLLLISYLGIDFECKGERMYRLLDCTITFMDEMPREGDTLRYNISINSFARSGDTLIFFFSYDCYVRDKLVLKMTNGCAGFFSEEELEGGRGVILTDKEREEQRNAQKRYFEPPLVCRKTAFTLPDLHALCVGDIATCFGAPYQQFGKNHSLRLPPQKLLMFDRVVSVDPQGGAWGLGTVVAEKDMAPDDWYFVCHFKDDHVLAGSLVAEGCGQLLQFYLLYLGMQCHTNDATFQPIPDMPQVVRCRGQVTPVHTKLTYRMEITDIGMEPRPYVVANTDILVNDRVVVRFTGLSLQLSEKALLSEPPPEAGQAAAPEPEPEPPAPAVQDVLIDQQRIRDFSTGSVSACFGPQYRIFDNRRAPRTPNGDLQLIDRVMWVDGEPHDFKPGTLLVSEYDVPADPWYYRHNAYPGTPYSILIEIGLQSCGFLCAYLGTMLLFPEADIYFRKIEGSACPLKPVDIRGKTVTTHARLLSATTIQGVSVQKYAYRLFCDDEAFYEGEATVGCFTPEAMNSRAGLDGGQIVRPWYEHQQSGLKAHIINLYSTYARQHLYCPPAGKPYYCLSHDQLNFLDQVMVVENGGQHGKGYIFASKRVNPDDWFFACHFYQDPVMPGSFGIEAVMQSMQVYAMQCKLGSQFASPHFEPVPNQQSSWKYRGQIVPTSLHWSLEVHITRIDRSPEQVVIVGDASLWREQVRIHEIKQLGIRIVETPA